MTRPTLTLIALPLLAGSVACGFHDRHHGDDWYDGGYDSPICGSRVESGTIDADEALETQPGEGVGVFVEYATGGRWHVYTACDTEFSGYDCYFDIVASPVGSATLTGLIPDSLERHDTLHLTGQDVVQLLAFTSTDHDGFYVDTEPGTALSLDVLLDGDCANGYLYWFGDGAIHQGAPSNPFELQPTEL